MAARWARDAAARIGRKAAAVAIATGRRRDNPFTGKGLDDLAEAWQQAYDRAVHPSAH